MIRTPVLPLQSSKIAALLPEGSEVFTKLELFQHTGSRPAEARCLAWTGLKGNRQISVATFSGGNHALAVAWASVPRCPAKVIMPKAADPLRIQGCQELGADVVLAEDIAAAAVLLEEVARQEGRKILHPFNDLNMAFGAATCGAEFIEDAAGLEIVVLPVGGGGLIAGMAAAIKQASPQTKIIGVEPKGANSLQQSFASGQPQALAEVKTIADSLGAPSALRESFELARDYVDEVIAIDDQVMADTMLQMRDRLNLFVEPACAASLGAALGRSSLS